MRLLLAAGVLCAVVSIAPAQVVSPQDTDHDGLTDALEDALLTQFAPRFMVSDDDCSLRPAQFVAFEKQPEVEKENGAIYGQATLSEGGRVELHYYHLWRKDCGENSHLLDAEHVSALVGQREHSQWKALYWYAAAHEDTVCDASQVARAPAVDGELHGPAVWISRGKHASFLRAEICARGCGGDKCRAMTILVGSPVINLGEPSKAMNGATWAASHQWPLADKMGRSDFATARVTRLDLLPPTGIAWANPGKPGMQSTIRVADSVRGTTAGGLNATGAALDTAQSNTGDALGAATANTGSGFARSGRGIRKALRATARALGLAE